MPNLYLLTLFTLLFPLSLSLTTFYIDETSKTNNPYGSRDHPFTSLDDAALRLSAGTFDIILLGPSITITSQVIFPSSSICIIRPQVVPIGGYYPLKFGIGASISVLQTNVTFQNIQFIELDPFRDPSVSAITVSAGFLFLDRTLVSDIQYGDSSYIFISAGEDSVTGTGLALSNTEFKNLANFQIFTTQTQVIIKNASFENIDMDNGAFLTLFSSNLPNIGLEMLNISLINARFGYQENQDSVGFVQILNSSVNVSIDVFSARNVSIVNGVPLIGVKEQEEDPQNPTIVDLWDVVLEDIVEIEDEQMNQGIGLIFDIAGPSGLTVQNLTARNVKFDNGCLLRYLPDTSQFLFTYDVLPQILLQDINISNSSNTNFLAFWVDSGLIEDVELINVTSKTFPIFFIQNAGSVSLANIYGRNISGSAISLQQVFSQNLENIMLYNVSISQGNVLPGPQSLIQSIRGSNITALGLRPSVGQSTVIADFFIDGYESIEAQDQEQKAYLMGIEAEIGTVLLRDSVWRNMNTGGLFSPNMNALKVDNLTVNGVSSQEAEIFKLENFEFVKIEDSRFHNNKNLGIVSVDIPDDAGNMITGYLISFENISVMENNVNSEGNNSLLPSNLFEFKSPTQVVSPKFVNCLFRDNEISGSVIKISESQRVNISLENNKFVRNYARGAGGIFSTDHMQEDMSVLTANNNVFLDNTCQDNGGIFYFDDSWNQVSLSNNTYKNNTSAENGGIGYILRSTISFLEQNSFYSDNSAQKDGGLWYIRSSHESQNPQPPISFINTVFSNSEAGSNGGAFYVLYGNLSITDSLFTKNRALQSGGAFYLEAFSSIFISSCVFDEMSSPEGSLVFAASLLNASIVMQGVNINNVSSTRGEGTLVDVNSGLVMVNNSQISGISGQLLFDFKGSSAEFNMVRISDIDCSEVKSACVVNGEAVELEWEDTVIADVVLQGDLVVLDEDSVEKGKVETVNIAKV